MEWTAPGPGFVVSEEQLRRDVEFLAGRLPHRRAITENERAAADFLLERFREYTPHAALDEFYSIDSYAYLFAAYYAEFLVVALLAIWSPWIGLVYGLIVFVLYMAEFTGYSIMSHLMPQYETQNVVARFFSRSPRRFVVVTANYDSPKATVLTQPNRAVWFRHAHLILVFAMVAVLLTCAAEGLHVFAGWDYPVAFWLRWMAVALLLITALALYSSENGGELTRGANNNASGTAVLLSLAERLHAEPLDSTDIWLVATGSKETWMSGMKQFLKRWDHGKADSYFVNVTSVGAGSLRYTEGEGMLHVFSCSKELLELARELAGEERVSPVTYRGLPTDALIPLVRGYKTLGIMGTDTNQLPSHWNWMTDTTQNVEINVLNRAARFVDAVVRRVDSMDNY